VPTRLGDEPKVDGEPAHPSNASGYAKGVNNIEMR